MAKGNDNGNKNAINNNINKITKEVKEILKRHLFILNPIWNNVIKLLLLYLQ